MSTLCAVFTLFCKAGGSAFCSQSLLSSEQPPQLKSGRAGTVARPTFSKPSAGKLKPKRQPWPGSSAGEITPWGFLGLFPLWGWRLGSLGVGATGQAGGVLAGAPPWPSALAKTGPGRSLSLPQASLRVLGPVPACGLTTPAHPGGAPSPRGGGARAGSSVLISFYHLRCLHVAIIPHLSKHLSHH